MKNRTIIFLLGILFPITLLAQQASALSIQQVLNLAEKNSPQLSASRFHELAAEKDFDIAKANYYPTIDAGAIESTGFPGSCSGLDVGGLMSSPYRSGYGVGVVAQQTIWDFGQTASAVETSKNEAQYSAEDTKVTVDQVKQLALQTYFECTLDRTQQNTWANLSDDSNLITQQVNNFVNTGQRSIVDGYLAKAQTEEAQTAQAYYAMLLQKTTQSLAILLGVPANSISCPAVPGDELLNHVQTDMNASPLMSRAKVSVDIAQAKIEQAQSSFNPKIVAEVSVGALERTRFVSNQGYAVGVGIVVPIVDVGTYDQIKHAEIEAAAQDQELAAEQQHLAEINANYDAVIDSSVVQLQHLNDEFILAKMAFKVAKQRYYSMQGDLEDVRDAFNNLARTQTQLNETRVALLQARGSKVLVDGGNL